MHYPAFRCFLFYIVKALKISSYSLVNRFSTYTYITVSALLEYYKKGYYKFRKWAQE